MPLSPKAKALGESLAFPLHFSTAEHQTGNVHDGLTKREHFAGMAMQGLTIYDHTGEDDLVYPDIAGKAVKYADALLEQLAKEET